MDKGAVTPEEPSTPTKVDKNNRDDDRRNLLIRQDSRAKYQSLKVRTLSTVAMVGSFIGVIYFGHVPLMCMIFLIQMTMVKELFKLARAYHHKENAPKMKAMQWYFFGVVAFWMYLRFINKNLLVEITSSRIAAKLFGWMLRRHTLISYSLYLAGFVTFVLKLERGNYLYQFGQYAWTHMILLVVFIPSSFFVSNIFDGLIWFLLPCSMVIINDIAAYLSGFFFGRTPLIRLSPKKTWEGFIGGCLLTMLASWYLADFLSRFQWMTCERTDLSMGWLDCDPDDIFKVQRICVADLARHLPHTPLTYLAALAHHLPPQPRVWLLESLPGFCFSARPMQLHALVMATFASVIAPFGGFFASGFKRGFKIKDFGDSIPGHGGMTDRMDCQVVMAVFSYVYFNNYISHSSMTVGAVLARVLQLSPQLQLELLEKLGNLLASEDVIPADFVPRLQAAVAAGQRALT